MTSEKRTEQWAVVPHAVDGVPTGRGFVARSLPFDRNYRGVNPVKVYHRRAAAERYASRLSDFRPDGGAECRHSQQIYDDQQGSTYCSKCGDWIIR